MNTIIMWVAKFAVGKHLAGAVAWLHNKLDGKRSELSTALIGLAFILNIAGVLTQEQFDTIKNALIPVLSVVLADKVSKALATAQAVIPKPEPEAPKP
jgi:hypothetical protein